jgi:hypothetical protein
MKKLKILLILLVLLSINLKAQSYQDSCHCKKLIKSFKYFEKSFYKKGEYFHYPQEPVIIYVDGSRTHPPLNKHIQVMLNYTPIELTNHGDLLIYRVAEKELQLWEYWLQEHCKERYEKYRKRHNYSKYKNEEVQQE